MFIIKKSKDMKHIFITTNLINYRAIIKLMFKSSCDVIKKSKIMEPLAETKNF
jgi:hypothetical protein